MKVGYRTPSLSKSLGSRTTGRVSRASKRATSPGYGRKGAGLLKDPGRSAYNKAYSKTTKSIF